MKRIFIVLISLIGSVAFGQENNIEHISLIANTIKSDSTLLLLKFNSTNKVEIGINDEGALKVWKNKESISKIVEEIILSQGRLTKTIYLHKGVPIKIIEKEDSFGFENGKLNYKKFKEEFRATVYIFDWENDVSKIEKTGQRIFSEGSCSTFDYEPIVEKAKKLAIKD
ncbi:hypothetical protein [Pontimicrobium aquaticum]|uniref:Uncharacterized protein n=1 Tax=Pontimicrobium aquaticum TaxID=2565367 RepID=A0A4U0EP49_9FLAO|nr:hypothetical protein [Pontimicrobium aquaticum]TJY33397.1 hypothetical protein E5167_12920 [Pontimicrobium aquaticum]